MSQGTSIEWTDATWNPVRGCSRVSEGCRNCYAERQAARFRGDDDPFHGFAYSDKAGPHWTGRVELIPEKLGEPLRWHKPRRIFVNSMSDLFHEKLSDEAIAAVFGVMAACQQHTFQVLTKRPERMRRWFEWAKPYKVADIIHEQVGLSSSARLFCETKARLAARPLRNVWLGVSVEDQETFDERVLHLVLTPAALRFVSYEPALGPLDFSLPVAPMATPLLRPRDPERGPGCVHWLIVGGESGPGARPFDLAWARSAVAQCKAAGVPVFVKQLGANAQDVVNGLAGAATRLPDVYPVATTRLRDRKGGDPSEWPEDLRVREFPA